MCNCGARRRAAAADRAIVPPGPAGRSRGLQAPPVVPPPPALPSKMAGSDVGFQPTGMTTTQTVMRRVRGRNIRIVETVPVVVDTAIWGPPMWRFLHGAAAAATAGVHREAWVALLTALRTSLPCPDCHAHYNAWWAAHPYTGEQPVADWLLSLHNDVNTRRGVPVWTAEQMVAGYPVDGALEAARAALEAAATAGVGAAAVAAGRTLLVAMAT